jgi:hypothetical protein
MDSQPDRQRNGEDSIVLFSDVNTFEVYNLLVILVYSRVFNLGGKVGN